MLTLGRAFLRSAAPLTGSVRLLSTRVTPRCPISKSDWQQHHENFSQRFTEAVLEGQTLNGMRKILPPSLVEYVVDVGGDDADKMIQETSLGGKTLRGITTAALAAQATSIDSESYTMGCDFGWAVELLQAHFLVEDDIMDAADTRRGKPAWYKEVGLKAINDGLLLQQVAYRLIRAGVHGVPTDPARIAGAGHIAYINYLTALGELLDTSPPAAMSDEFNPVTYRNICVNKTGHYTFHLPISLGIYAALSTIAPHYSPQEMRACADQVEELCNKFGHLYQIQDDVLDVYGDPEVTGKYGTDIYDRKCSWLAMMSDFDNPSTPDDVIKGYFDQLDLLSSFKELEEHMVGGLEQEIDLLEVTKLPSGVLSATKDILHTLLFHIAYREK